MTILDFLHKYSAEFPAREAIVVNHEVTGYRELEERSNRIAAQLWQRGVRPGDKVGILMENCIENILLFFAIQKVKAVEVSLVTSFPMNKITDIIKRTAVKLVIYKTGQGSLGEELTSKNRFFPGVSWKELQDIKVLAPPPAVSYREDDYILFQFTSGTTGIPRCCVLTHKNFISAAISHNDFISADASMRLLNILPLHHSCSKSMLVESIAAGATMILEKGFKSPLKLLKVIQANRVTHITGPPFIFHYLSKLKNEKTLNQLKEHLRVFEIGLSSIPSTLITHLHQTFPWVSIFNRFGMTENASAASLLCISHHWHNRRGKECSCGKGLDCTSIDVVGENNEIAPPGETGEIVIRGTNLMVGYWEDIQKDILHDYEKEWLHTGDMAVKDEKGFIYVKGRNDEFVNIMGNKLHLKEISNIVLKMKGIENAAVVDIADDIHGTRLILFVTNEKKTSPGGKSKRKILQKKYAVVYDAL